MTWRCLLALFTWLYFLVLFSGRKSDDNDDVLHGRCSECIGNVHTQISHIVRRGLPITSYFIVRLAASAVAAVPPEVT
jgi:hypothetical protein